MDTWDSSTPTPWTRTVSETQQGTVVVVRDAAGRRVFTISAPNHDATCRALVRILDTMIRSINSRLGGS